ncbi:hypothetical protein [Streptomyces sp. NPDC059753]|uniref:hypothetical protein n=1 Tax=Streptomyces sp. NPDC059753 TaxID=3346933 RepID=UPI00364C93FF
MKDSFGIEIEEGDYILSASTSGARVKVGHAYQGNNGLMMRVDLSAQYGKQEHGHRKSGQLGHNVVVLRKADGTVPTHVGASVPSVDDVESELRDLLANLDYDLHKAQEHDEETGEDKYPEMARAFHAGITGGSA